METASAECKGRFSFRELLLSAVYSAEENKFPTGFPVQSASRKMNRWINVCLSGEPSVLQPTSRRQRWQLIYITNDQNLPEPAGETGERKQAKRPLTRLNGWGFSPPY